MFGGEYVEFVILKVFLGLQPLNKTLRLVLYVVHNE